MNVPDTGRLDGTVDPVSFSTRVWRTVTLGDRLGRRAAIVLWVAVAIGVALLLGWNFVVAAGLSTLVLGLLPCAVMCVAGLCAGSSGSRCPRPPQSKEKLE